MKYYLIYLQSGTVIDVCSFDDQESRDNLYNEWVYRDEIKCWANYDNVQCLNVVV